MFFFVGKHVKYRSSKASSMILRLINYIACIILVFQMSIDQGNICGLYCFAKIFLTNYHISTKVYFLLIFIYSNYIRVTKEVDIGPVVAV